MVVRSNTYLKANFQGRDPQNWHDDLIDSLALGDWSRSVTQWWVDSTNANASDANAGTDSDNPLATIDGAFGKALAVGDIVWVMPGHVESLAAATIDMDLPGVFVVGVGSGDSRPQVHFDNAAASVDIGANNITVSGIRFLPSVTAVLIGVDIEAAVTGTVIQDCEFMVGEDGAGVDEFVLSIDVKAACDDTVIRGNRFYTHVAAAGATDAVKLTGASSRCLIHDNIIDGTYSTAGITNDTAAALNLYVAWNTIKVADGEPGIELFATATGRVVFNTVASTGLSVDLMIVAADCEWSENYGIALDGETGSLIGEPSQDHTQALIDNLLSKYVDIGNVFFVDGGASGPVVDTGSGFSAADPKQLLQSGLDLTVDGNDDFVIVLNYGGNARAVETWPVTFSKSKTHIVGVGNVAQKWPVVSVLAPGAGDTASPAILVTGDRSSIEGLELGGGDTAGCVHVGDGGGTWGVEISSCFFGVTGDSVGQDGIRMAAGLPAPYLTVFGCRFGHFITRDGVRFDANATRCMIGVPGQPNNYFHHLAGIAINVASAVTEPGIHNNVIAIPANTAGAAITLAAGVLDAWVFGNVANFGDTDMGNNPYLDNAGAGANDWANNMQGITLVQPA